VVLVIVGFKTKLVLKSSGFRVMQTLVMIVIGFVMMPFMISTLGEELYGLWIVVGSVVGTYYLLDMGFSQAITRYVSKYIHQNNPEAANRVINTALILYSTLGLVVLLISIVAAKFGVESLMGDSKNISLAQALLVISGLTLALEFPAKSFPGIVSAYMRYDFIALVRVIKSIADALLIYLFLSNGYGLVSIAIITLVTGVISTVIYVRFTSSLFKELCFSQSLVDFTTLKDVFHFSKWVFVFDMNAMFRDKMDVWFIAFYQSSGVLTIYYVAVRLTEYALQFLTQATGITGPIFTEYYAKGEQQKLQQSVIAFIKVDVFLGSIFLVGFYLVGESFIRLWMGNDFAFREAFLCLVILATGRFAVYFSSPLQSLLMTLNHHSIGAWISVAETLMSALLLWILTPLYGIIGAALAIAIPTFLGRLVVLPIFVSQIVSIGFAQLILRTIFFVTVTAVVLFASKYYFVSLNDLSLTGLLAVAPVIGIVQITIGLSLFTKEELRWVAQQVKNKWGKNSIAGEKH
jgi:O-antigen/teichoic acid export membrane protein